MRESACPLPLVRRRQLDRAIRQSTETYLTSTRDELEAREIPALLAVRAMHRAQDLLGRPFAETDIELWEDCDADEPTFMVTLCGAPIAWVALPLYGTLITPMHGHCPGHWLLHPECPLFVFHGDWPQLPNVPPEAQELFSIPLLERDPADPRTPRQALLHMLDDATIDRLTDAVRTEMLERVRRRLRAGGDRELYVGWRPALPTDAQPPVRRPRRLQPRRRPDRHAWRHAERWWTEYLPAA